MIISSIPVNEADTSTDGWREWSAADEFAVWAITEGRMQPGEFPDEAIMTREASVYVGQVMNGGHWQYLVNGCLKPQSLDRLARCLDAAGAATSLGIIHDFKALLEANPDWVDQAKEERWQDDVPPEVEALDGRFYGGEGADGIVEAVGAWLRRTASFTAMPHAAIAGWRQRILDSHPELAARPSPA